jgi:hypothetical protein
MKRLASGALSLAAVLGLAAAAEPPAPPPLQIEGVPSPAARGARSPVLAVGPDGIVWMAWFEPVLPDSAAWVVRCSEFDPATGQWRSAHSMAPARESDTGGDGLPSLVACGNGRLFVSWSKPSAGAGSSLSFFSSSTDGGCTWTAPSLLSRREGDAAFPALATLADGRVLAAWLNRGGQSGPDTGAGLYLRFLTGPLAAAPDWLLDGHAAGNSQPDLAPLLDGGVLLAYRGLSEAGIADPRIARLHGRKWENRRSISPDGWKGDRADAGGPCIAADGGRLVAVWRTANPADPHILVSTSPDAGARFLAPLRVNAGTPAGLPGVALLHDGAALIVWSEQDPAGSVGVWVRRLAPDFSLNAPMYLEPVPAQGPAAVPQIAIVHDYASDVLAAQAIIACRTSGGPPGVRTVLLNIPEADLLSTADENCHCSPTPMQLVGYSLLGTVVSLSSDRTSATIESDAVPGVLDAGRHVYAIDPWLGALLQPGRECLAHIIRKDGQWRLLDARLLDTGH